MSAETNIQANVFEEVVIGTQTWMAQNYDFGGTWPANNIDNITEYGKTYTWAEAVAIADGTVGWHLPTHDELYALQQYVADPTPIYTGGGHLKKVGTTHWLAPNTGADNSTGFGAVGSIGGLLGYDCYIWGEENSEDTDEAFILTLAHDNDYCGLSVYAKTGQCAVRLIKD